MQRRIISLLMIIVVALSQVTAVFAVSEILDANVLFEADFENGIAALMK